MKDEVEYQLEAIEQDISMWKEKAAECQSDGSRYEERLRLLKKEGVLFCLCT